VQGPSAGAPNRSATPLTVEFPDQPSRQLVPESLYQARYAATPVLQRTFRTRRWRRRRRPHRSPDARLRYRLATPIVMIDQRPSAADDRVEVGHRKGDLIMRVGNRSAIGTLVERSARTLILVHLPHGRTAAAVRDALTKVCTDLHAGPRRIRPVTRGPSQADMANGGTPPRNARTKATADGAGSPRTRTVAPGSSPPTATTTNDCPAAPSGARSPPWTRRWVPAPAQAHGATVLVTSGQFL